MNCKTCGTELYIARICFEIADEHDYEDDGEVEYDFDEVGLAESISDPIPYCSKCDKFGIHTGFRTEYVDKEGQDGLYIYTPVDGTEELTTLTW